MPEGQKIRHGSYIGSDKKFKEIVAGVLRERKELLEALKELGD
ncbi:hypothetical protein [Methanosarcina mazei]|jgi:hypothetical protein|nr:hypothetical protein [Methanosarcina mazei]BBL64944.1 hypothetical protein MmazTMA_19210 [Methanosarcina mazei]